MYTGNRGLACSFLVCPLDAPSSLVRFRVPCGDRPDLSLDCSQADGLADIVELMKRCWVKEPSARPSFKGADGSNV